MPQQHQAPCLHKCFFFLRCTRRPKWAYACRGPCHAASCHSLQASYTQASTIAQQALSQIRTVVSYGGEEKALDQYKEQLEGPVKVG